jgi:uncharacterized membrane protein
MKKGKELGSLFCAQTNEHTNTHFGYTLRLRTSLCRHTKHKRVQLPPESHRYVRLFTFVQIIFLLSSI